MNANVEQDLALLKDRLLGMASQAEKAATRAVRALLRRDDDLALEVKGNDPEVDRLQMEVDELGLAILALIGNCFLTLRGSKRRGGYDKLKRLSIDRFTQLPLQSPWIQDVKVTPEQ